MLHIMFQGNRQSSSGEEDVLFFTTYRHGGRFGHVILPEKSYEIKLLVQKISHLQDYELENEVKVIRD